jgi:cobalt-zinc-cadmium efflux system protein
VEPHSKINDENNLKTALFITLIFFFIEVAGGYYFNSLSLLGDAGHMLRDLAGLLIALYATRVCERLPTKTRTFGFHRTEVLAALVNGILLVLVSIWIFVEGAGRLSNPQPIQSEGMLVIAVIGLLANLYVAKRLGSGKDINMKAAYLHVLTDALSSVAVIVAAIIIWFTGFVVVDALMAFAIAVFILWSSIPVMREGVRIIMQGTPPDVDVDKLIAELEKVKSVKNVHNVHVWSICSNVNMLDCHVYTSCCDLAELEKIKRELRKKAERFGIRHTTFEFEAEVCLHPARHRRITH